LTPGTLRWTLQVAVLGTLLGNYRVITQLGEGGMGVVYIGRHETLGRRVVVKVLQPEMSRHADMVQRFFNEAQAAAAIHNPGIAQVFDFGTTPDGRAYFVMELLAGESLTDRLKKRRLDYVECCRIGRQIANVMQTAHAAGITHRDLKPDNLFLVPDPEVTGGERVKVLDFGIAKLTGESFPTGLQTGMGLVMGTPSYMAPEQCVSASAADARSDIYALGCVLFKMACGRPPFIGKGLGDIIDAHLNAPPPRPQSFAPDIPPALAQLISHLLAKQPNARPQTMTAVSQSLGEILRALGEPSPRAPTPLPELGPAQPSEPDSLLSTHELLLLEPDPTEPPARAPRLFPLPAPKEESGPTPAPSPEPPSLPPHARATTPLPPASPAPLSADAPEPAPTPPQPLDPDATGSAAQRATAPPRAGRRQLLAALAILIAAVAAAILVVVLGAKDPASPGRLISYAEVMGPSRHEATAPVVDTTAVDDAPAVADPSPAPPPAEIAADPAATAGPPAQPGDVEAECRGYQRNRRWAELEQCADKLRPLDPKGAAALKIRAVEEAKAMSRVAAIEAALRAPDLKRARAELDRLWRESVQYPNIKHRYELAEAQAITDLAAQLERVKSADCEEYNSLLEQEQALRPARVLAEAARQIPCSPGPCIAEGLAEDGRKQYARGELAAALASYEGAYACRAVPEWAEKAFIIACNQRDLAKARLHWGRLRSLMQPRVLGICERNEITEPMLSAP
jgi:serine/threonine-protein kinase